MAFVPSENYPGLVSFTNIDTSANRTIPVGTVVRGFDPVNGGGGEFVYANGVGSNAVGSLATWNAVAKTATLVPSTAKLGYPVCVSLTANTTTTSYSWYQIAGAATILKTAIVAAKNSRLFISATTATVFVTSTAGKCILNAITVNSTVSANTFLVALINRPFMEPVAT